MTETNRRLTARLLQNYYIKTQHLDYIKRNYFTSFFKDFGWENWFSILPRDFFRTDVVTKIEVDCSLEPEYYLKLFNE